jgi:hypothetical protein
MDSAARRSGGGGFFEGFYKVVMRRTSVYATFVIAGAFLGERVRLQFCSLFFFFFRCIILFDFSISIIFCLVAKISEEKGKEMIDFIFFFESHGLVNIDLSLAVSLDPLYGYVIFDYRETAD